MLGKSAEKLPYYLREGESGPGPASGTQTSAPTHRSGQLLSVTGSREAESPLSPGRVGEG